MRGGTDVLQRVFELTRARAFEVLVLTLALAFSVHAHLKAGFSLPYPWPDEAAFLWPALSVDGDRWYVRKLR